MPRGKSAISTRSDDSGIDVDASEIDKLQRQFRIMEGDRQAYSIQARKQIRKQEQEIEKLLKEQEELQCNLGVCKSLTRQQMDNEETQHLRALLEQIDLIEEDFEKEKQNQKHLEKEINDKHWYYEQISRLELKLKETKKGEVSRGDKQKTEVRRTQKAIRTLENKLDRALANFSEQLTKNRHLREELQILHIERVHFQQLYKRMDRELQEVRKKIGEVISHSTAAYDARVEAQSKMTMMKEKTVKDLVQYNTEMKELERVISHEYNLKIFMTTKCERTGQGVDQENGQKQLSELKEPKRMDSGEESLDVLEEVFERIQRVTGEENLDLMVTKFLQVEDRNFALFNFVNEQNKEGNTLRDQINQIKEEMERSQNEGLLQEENHSSVLKKIDDQQKEILSHAEEYENQATSINQILDLIKTGVNNIFTKIGCDPSVIEDLLGSSTEITDNNIISYLGQIEQRTNELLTIQAYLQSKDLEKEYNPKDLAKFLLGQNPIMLQEADAIQTTISSVDYNTEESLAPDEEERPLSQGELRKRIMNEVMQKETNLQSSSRQTRSLEDPLP